MTNGQHVARSRHLEELARAAKLYTLREILDVTEAVAAELGGLSSPNYDDFTGATAIAGGLSGLVPAPHAGDESKFLRGDGTWATVESGSSGGTVLGTVPSTIDGGVWYSLSPPALNFRKGNYVHKFSCDRLEFVGNATDGQLVAYLPFDSNLADKFDNIWNWYSDDPPNVAGALYLGGDCLINNGLSADIGSLPWTVDFWATVKGGYGIFGTFNALYGTSGTGTNYWVGLMWNGGQIAFHTYGGDPAGTISVENNTRHHYAMTYDGTNVRIFIDGVLSLTREHQITLGGDFVIGSTANHNEYISGTIDHFRIFKGVALWTENFTPPTESDYL